MIKKIKKNISEYFQLSPSALRGIALILLLLIIIAIIPSMYTYFKSSDIIIIDTNEIRKYDEAFDQLVSVQDSQTSSQTYEYKQGTSISYYHGNQNETYKKAVVSYYGSKYSTKVSKYQNIKEKHQTVEINSSDTTLLEQLPGIGKTLSKRIIKYRNLLGGFYSINQLEEVYGVNQDVFNKVKAYIDVDTLLINRIDITKCDKSLLFKHPYIGKAIAIDILKYRTCHPEKKLKNMVQDNTIPKNLLDKLQPYLIY